MFRKVLFSYWLLIGLMVMVFSVNVRPAAAHTLEATGVTNRIPGVLADYWAKNGNWQAVEPALSQASLLSGQALALSDSQGQLVATAGSFQALETANSVPVKAGPNNTTVGFLYLGKLDAATLNPAENGDSWPGLAGIGLAAGLLSLGLGWLLTRSIVRPVRRLNEAVARLAQGDYSVRVGPGNYGKDELSRLSQTFDRLAERMGKLEQRRQRLLADVSHDLRTPLGVIGGYLEGLCNNQIADRRQAERAFQAMQTEVAQLVTLSERLSGRKLQRKPIAPRQLATLALERMAALARAKEVRLVNEVNGNLPPWSLDAGRMGQALYNLLENAIRHTPAGGQISLNGRVEAGQLQLSVQDTGEGITPTDLPHIFERGYQASPNRGSAGLGLAIARQIVIEHGGQIRAYSDASGSWFVIELPPARP